MDFSKIWATNGDASAPTDAQYLQGFGFLGSAPPTAELFNYLFQMLDMKAKALNDADSTLFWQSATAYSVGAIRLPSTFSHKYMECTVAGTSGMTEPTLPAVGSTVTDGGVTWIARDLRALPLAGGTMSGQIAMGSNKITELADGVADGDAVNYGQFDSNLAAPGYQKLPNKNIMQYGSISASSNTAVTFPIAFGEVPYHIDVCITATGAPAGPIYNAEATNISASSFAIYVSSQAISGGAWSAGSHVVSWFAIGKLP